MRARGRVRGGGARRVSVGGGFAHDQEAGGQDVGEAGGPDDREAGGPDDREGGGFRASGRRRTCRHERDQGGPRADRSVEHRNRVEGRAQGGLGKLQVRFGAKTTNFTILRLQQIRVAKLCFYVVADEKRVSIGGVPETKVDLWGIRNQIQHVGY